MDATVVEVRVRIGEAVAAGAVVAELEAMTMELEIRSATAGTVEQILVEAGAAVAAGTALVTLS
jgi:oxaloacetate decarboxylase alpha subunit